MLITRILTSLILIPLFLAALFLLSNRNWSLLTLVIVTLAAFEWGDICRFSVLTKRIFVAVLLLAGAVVAIRPRPGPTVFVDRLAL